MATTQAKRWWVSALAATSLMVVAACGGGTSKSTDNTTSGAALDPDATLRVSTAGTPQTVDPALQKTTGEQVYSFLIYDRLTKINNTYDIEPMLATGWKFASDGKSVTFTLRTDVKFHDGTTFDASAVKANIERGKTLTGSTIASSLANVTSVDVVSPTEAKFNLASGGAELPALLASNVGEMVSPAAIADKRDLNLNPGNAGSGPYVLTSLKPNEGATYERATGDYWDTKVKRVKAVQLSYIAASSGRLNGVRAGQLDMGQVTGTDVAPAQQLVDSKQLSGDGAWQASQMGIFLRATHDNLKDVKVRQALEYAIDKKAITNDLYAGNCKEATQNFPDTHWAYNKSVASLYSYDPNKAKSMLAAAGASDLKLTMVYASGSTFEQLAQVIQAQLAKIGVTVTLTGEPQANAVADFRAGKFDTAVMSIVGASDPSVIYSSFYTGGYNLAVDPNGTLAAAVKAANNPTQSTSAREKAYQDLAKTVADDAWNVPICFSKQLWVHTDKIAGVADMGWIWAGIPDLRSVYVTK